MLPTLGANADVCCKAECFHVPCPNNAMANDTTACTAECPKGDGSPGATDIHVQCVENCIKQHFFSVTSAMPNPTGTAGTPTGSSGSGKMISFIFFNIVMGLAVSAGSLPSNNVLHPALVGDTNDVYRW